MRPNLHTTSGLAAILLWCATFALARSASEQVGPVTTGAAVYLFGGLLLCVLSLCFGTSSITKVFRLPRNYLFGCGFLFVLYTVVLYLAVGLAKDRVQLLEIALLNYLWPALTILFSLPLLKHRANILLVPGTAAALIGVFFVLTQGAHVTWASFLEHLQSNPAAYFLALVAAVSWGLYSNLTRLWADPAGGGAVVLFIPVSGVVLLALRLFYHEPAAWTLRNLGEIALLGTITALGYFFWEVAMRKGNLLLVTVCSYFTPLLSTFISCLYLQVLPGPQLWLGCLLVMLGSAITRASVSAQRGA